MHITSKWGKILSHWLLTGWPEDFRSCWSTGIFYSHTQNVKKTKKMHPVSGSSTGRKAWERTKARLVWVHMQAMRTKIIILYTCAKQKIISACITYYTWRLIAYNSRKPHQGPLLLAKNKNLRITAEIHRNCTAEDWEKENLLIFFQSPANWIQSRMMANLLYHRHNVVVCVFTLTACSVPGSALDLSVCSVWIRFQ